MLSAPLIKINWRTVVVSASGLEIVRFSTQPARHVFGGQVRIPVQHLRRQFARPFQQMGVSHNVLRRLIDKGLFQNENGLVTAVISREDFYARQSRQYVEDTFAGSLPAFIAAFTQDAKLTPEEAEAIRKMIDQAEEK